MQHVEACELQASLDAETIRILDTQVAELQDALVPEHARSEKHAEAFMRVSRSRDDWAREMEAQHAAAIIAKDTFIHRETRGREKSDHQRLGVYDPQVGGYAWQTGGRERGAQITD
jgi:hypothetical protein